MYGTQDWPYLTLLVTLFGCMIIRQGFSKIMQFNPEFLLNDSWQYSLSFSRRDRVRLNCNTDDRDFSLVSIIRPQNAMNVLSHQVVQECQTGWCIHEFESITCNDMGTYVCKDGKNSSRETEVPLNNCEPRLCNGEEKSRIIHTAVNETKTFSFCVAAYPGIKDSALLNSERIQANRNDSEQWSWYYEKTRFAEFMVHITVTTAIPPRPESYPFTFTIFTYGTQRLHLNYSFELQVLGPPECPTDLQVTEVGVDFVTLSWLPGWDGGSEQSFQVNYSTEDSENWTRHPVVFGEVKSVTITGLDKSTNYTFRILPSNSFTKDVVNCEDTVLAKTLAKTPGSPTTAPGIQVISPSKDAPSATLALVIIIVIVVIIIAFGVVGVVVFFKITKILARARNVRNPTSANTRRRDPAVEQRTSGADSEQNLLALTSVSNSTNSEDSGHYLSPEGLTYITIDHGTNPGRRTPSRAKRQNERVQYVTLDFEKTRKFAVNHLNEFNGTDNRTEKLYVNAY